MKIIYDQLARYTLLRAALALVLGIVMIVLPQQVVAGIVYLIAACLAIYGIIYFIGGLRSSAGTGASSGVVIGVILAVAAVVMLLFTRQIASILPIFLGALLILAGVAQLIAEIRSQDKGPADIARILLSLLVIAGGILGIVNPFGTLGFLVRILGIVVLLTGLNELIYFFRAQSLQRAGKTQAGDNTDPN